MNAADSSTENTTDNTSVNAADISVANATDSSEVNASNSTAADSSVANASNSAAAPLPMYVINGFFQEGMIQGKKYATSGSILGFIIIT